MSQVEVLAAQDAVNFDYEFTSCSPSSLSSSQNKVFTNALVESILSSSQHHLLVHDVPHIEEVGIAGLPHLHYGHPDIHLRRGVMRALHLATDGEPDAERAFFVADLSCVYQQHLRWQKLLPEIQPFYGKSVFPSIHRTRVLMTS